jgi:hypothetical protein
MRRAGRINVEWDTPLEPNYRWEHVTIACYASPERIFVTSERVGRDYKPFTIYYDAWPWADKDWKPKDRRRDLIRAAALIVAEIERLDRATS